MMRTSCRQGGKHDWNVGQRLYMRRERGDAKSRWHARPVYRCKVCGKEVEI